MQTHNMTHPPVANAGGATIARLAAALLAASVLTGGVGASALVQAQDAAPRYPTKPVRIIVPFAPAGGTDILARGLAQRLTESMGQQVIVENRPGGNSIIGTDLVAKAAPDGHTILFTTNVITINPSLQPSLPFDTERDFAAVTIACATPNLLAAHPSIPVRTVKELIALARARPGALTIAAAGIGTPSHLAGELFKQMAKIDVLTVHYKGTGASLADVAGGQVAMTFGALPGLVPLVQGGRLYPLGVSGPKRIASLPEVPTITESLPGFEIETWYAVLVPGKTPPPVVTRIHTEIVQALGHPEIKQRLATQGFEPRGISPEAFTKIMRADIARWAEVIRAGNIRPAY